MTDHMSAAMAHANRCAEAGDTEGAGRWLQIFILREVAREVTHKDYSASQYIVAMRIENAQLKKEIASLRHQLNSKTRAEYEAREIK